MKFAGGPPRGSDDGPEPRPGPWFSPPEHWLGVSAAAPVVLTRTDLAAIGLAHVTAYPQGCLFTLRLLARRGPDTTDERWWRLSDSLMGPRAHAHPGRRRTPDRPQVTLRFRDGSELTEAGFALPFGDEPAGPVLNQGGGTASGSDGEVTADRSLWLWPLPAPEPFDLLVEWPAADIGPTPTTLDGAVVVAAAARARALWPDPAG